MTPEERMIAGAETDDIHIVHRRDRFPIRGTKAEKRAERGVAACFVIAAMSGVAFIVYFCAGAWKWHLPGTAQNFRFYTPILGGLLAALLLFLGLGLVLWAKWLMPEEEVIQERHDDATTEEDKLMTEATLTVGLDDTGLPRRGLILRSLGLAGGALLTVPLVALVGAMIKKPGDQLFHTMFRPNKKMFPKTGGRVPIVYHDWRQVSPGRPRARRDHHRVPRRAGAGRERLRRHDLRVVADDHHPAAPGPDRQVPQGPGRLRLAGAATPSTSRSPRSAPTRAARPRCTSSRPRACCARATSRSSRCSSTRSRCSARPPAACRSCPSTWWSVTTDRQYFVARSDYHEAIGPGFWERP